MVNPFWQCTYTILKVIKKIIFLYSAQEKSNEKVHSQQWTCLCSYAQDRKYKRHKNVLTDLIMSMFSISIPRLVKHCNYCIFWWGYCYLFLWGNYNFIISGVFLSVFVLRPAKTYIFQDYFVLLPGAYYEAAILVDHVTIPCKLGEGGTCRFFTFPNITSFDLVQGEGGYVVEGDRKDTFVDAFSLNEKVYKHSCCSINWYLMCAIIIY